MSDILKEICDNKREEVAKNKEVISLELLRDRIADQKLPRGFIQSIKSFQDKGEPAFICEIKKKSPSKGIIREDFNPTEIAKIYQENGAACISCLTDEKYFAGKNEYLEEVKKVTNIPILRKDFMVDPYQIFESRALGADCILIILAALEDDIALELEDLALSLGMDALIEVHDEQEMERALKMKSKLVGVNNRNLKTMEVTLDTSRNLSKMMTAEHIKVCESGISNSEEIKDMQNHGFNAFLIGESLMKQNDIAEALRKLTPQQVRGDN